MPKQLSHLNALDRTLTYNEAISMNVYCLSHPLAHLRPGLSRQGFARACDLRRMPSDSIVKVMGLTVIVHTPPTKSGKRVMFLTLEDETGLIDVVVFEKTQKQLRPNHSHKRSPCLGRKITAPGSERSFYIDSNAENV